MSLRAEKPVSLGQAVCVKILIKDKVINICHEIFKKTQKQNLNYKNNLIALFLKHCLVCLFSTTFHSISGGIDGRGC